MIVLIVVVVCLSLVRGVVKCLSCRVLYLWCLLRFVAVRCVLCVGLRVLCCVMVRFALLFCVCIVEFCLV